MPHVRFWGVSSQVARGTAGRVRRVGRGVFDFGGSSCGHLKYGQAYTRHGGRWDGQGFGRNDDIDRGGGHPAAPDVADRVGSTWKDVDRGAADGGDAEGL